MFTREKMAIKRVRKLGDRLFQADACYEQTTVSQLTRFEDLFLEQPHLGSWK